MEVKTDNLSVGYEERIIVDKFDLAIKKGEITTIIGPNGCGKSTVLKTLTRMIKAKSGTVTIDGQDLESLSTKNIARKIAVLSQMQSAPPDFKVKELVSYGRIPHQKWFAGASNDDEKIIKWAMEATSIIQMAERCINHLSGGERQRAWLATALAQKPEILFLDEPTTYLDIAHQIELMNIVKKLNKETGIGVVMVLHDIAQAMEVSHKIVVIKNGVKYSEGRPKDVITSKMLKEVYDVDAEIINIPGKEQPVIIYNGINK